MRPSDREETELEPGRLPQREWSRFWGVRFRARERLARSLIVVPCAYIVGAFVLAEWLTSLETNRDLLSVGLDADSARTVLSSVASGMIAFTGLVVSIAVVVVQFGASQYTPRLVNGFRRDPRVKHSLGIFIAPAIYALVALPKVGQGHARAVPGLTVAVSLILLMAAVIAFFLLVAGLLDLLRPRRVIGRVVRQAAIAIRQTYPMTMRAGSVPTPPNRPDTPVSESIPHLGGPGVVSALDRGRLVRAAKAADATIEVCVPVGGYVPRGAPLFRIRGGSTDVDTHELRRSVIFADERTITQDPAFAIRAVVDLALRALSPAVNDPTTAVQALDGLDSLLGELASRDLSGHGIVIDVHDRVRLVYPTPTWSGLLELSLSEIRRYGASSPQIPRRMRALLTRLLTIAPTDRHGAIETELTRLDAAVAVAFPDPGERAHAQQADPLGLGGSDQPLTGI